jgi:hypothetical protein
MAWKESKLMWKFENFHIRNFGITYAQNIYIVYICFKQSILMYDEHFEFCYKCS